MSVVALYVRQTHRCRCWGRAHVCSYRTCKHRICKRRTFCCSVSVLLLSPALTLTLFTAGAEVLAHSLFTSLRQGKDEATRDATCVDLVDRGFSLLLRGCAAGHAQFRSLNSVCSPASPVPALRSLGYRKLCCSMLPTCTTCGFCLF